MCDGRTLPASSLGDSIITRQAPAWAGLPTDRPLVMGILNVTPDSFSDGGRHANPVAAGFSMIEAGADIVDVGGESTRPGSSETDAETEQRRVLSVVAALASAGAVVSIDTRHATTMRGALDRGARIVNDVSGFAHDPAAAAVVHRAACPVVVMHMRGTPATMQALAQYGDIVRDVTAELASRLAQLDLPEGQVAVDPGIGFAKGAGHNEALLARLPLLLNLGCRVVVGASRKGFIGRLSGAAEPKHRDAGSVAAACAAVLGGAAIVRVHDVAATVEALRVWHGIASAG